MAATNTPSTGRKGDKKVRDALLAALRQDEGRLKKAAEKVWEMAGEGDMQAFREIADRLDGKAAQPIVGDNDFDPVDLSLKIEWVPVGDDKAT